LATTREPVRAPPWRAAARSPGGWRDGAVVILAVAVLGGVGGTIGGVREIIDLFNDEPEPGTRRTSPVRLDPSELRTARNFRYGFSFQYPRHLGASGSCERRRAGRDRSAAGVSSSWRMALSPISGRAPTMRSSGWTISRASSRTLEAHASSRAPASRTSRNRLPAARPSKSQARASSWRPMPPTKAPALTSVALATTTPDRDVTMRLGRAVCFESRSGTRKRLRMGRGSRSSGRN
jgi:hypothetical protein